MIWKPFCLFAIIFFFAGTNLPAQSIQALPDSSEFYMEGADTIFTKLKDPAHYKGYIPAYNKFLEKNLKSTTPGDNGAPPGDYVTVVELIIEPDGKLSNLRLLKDAWYGTGKEVLRLLQKSPLWVPAIHDGRPVKFLTKLSIYFSLREG